MIYRLFIALTITSALSGCLKTQSSEEQEEEVSSLPTKTVSPIVENPNQVISLFGAILPEKDVPKGRLARREKQLEEAKAAYEQNPQKEENIIWYGRRLAYLGRYPEAIRIYSIGLDLYPNSYKLLRHRGHRYITIRKFNEAIEDLQQAAFYARPVINTIEPDGLPNRLNKPLSNDKFNIWYYLGIAYYFKDNYDKAISAFKKCLTFCNNDDLRVAASDWFYMTYRKIGNINAANELLTNITRRMDIIENYSYHQRLLMYQKVYEPETLINKAERKNESLDPTLAYGIGNFYLYSGKVEKAKDIYEKILLNPQWDALGYIATEVDMISISNL